MRVCEQERATFINKQKALRFQRRVDSVQLVLRYYRKLIQR